MWFASSKQVSVSCGIPDFRSQNGIYARLSVEYPDLPDPQAMFDIHYFHNNQKPFFKFAKVFKYVFMCIYVCVKMYVCVYEGNKIFEGNWNPPKSH